MRGMRSLGAGALLVGLCAAAPRSAAADCGSDGYRYAPGYSGSFKSYDFSAQLDDPVTHAKSATAKTARVCKDCAQPLRGVRLTAKADFGSGFFQFPTPLGDDVCVQAVVDVSRILGSDGFGGLELDSPYVALPDVPLSGYVFVGVQDLEGTLTVWANLSGSDAGTPLALPAGTQSVLVELHYTGGVVDVSARAMQDEALTPVLAGGSLPYAGSARLGAGAFDMEKGGKVGVAAAIQGDLYDATLQGVLDQIAAVVALEDGAVVDLGAAATADARAKLDQAHAAIDPALLTAVAALPESSAQASALAAFTKAAARQLAAIAAIDANMPASLASAGKLAAKARAGTLGAERILETGVAAEGK